MYTEDNDLKKNSKGKDKKSKDFSTLLLVHWLPNEETGRILMLYLCYIKCIQSREMTTRKRRKSKFLLLMLCRQPFQPEKHRLHIVTHIQHVMEILHFIVSTQLTQYWSCNLCAIDQWSKIWNWILHAIYLYALNKTG